MVKFVKGFAITCIFIAAFITSAERVNYKLDATVKSSRDGLVLAESADGNLWAFEGDFEKGSQIVLELFDNHTLQVDDDEVINAWLK